MKKNTRTLLITILSFAVVIIIAAVAYNVLKKNAPAVSFTPTLAIEAESPELKRQQEPQPKAIEATKPTASADSPSDTFDQSVAEEDAAQDANADVQAEPEEDKGPMMPNLPLNRLDGSVTSFEEVRDGKPAIINYFASWCPPCKQELPHFQKAFDEYGDEISFIFLDALDGQRETLKTINAFIKSFPFTGPVFYDDGMFAAVFQTSSLPTTVFLDKEGRVVKGYLGFVPEEVLYADIAALLD